MTQDNKPHESLPVPGYRPQSEQSVALVTQMKQLEENVLRSLDMLRNYSDGDSGVDQRWLAIGRTSIEQGFMAVNRSVFKPDRVKLPGDGGATMPADFQSGGKPTTGL